MGPVLIAVQPEWPLLAVAVVVVVAACLWGLFRRGSIADRARADEPGLGQGRDDGPASEAN